MKTWPIKFNKRVCIKQHIALFMLPVLIILSIYVILQKPKQCVLCGGQQYRAPCLVNLSTGEVGELTVYDTDFSCSWQLSEVQQTGTFCFVHCAGLIGTRDTSAHTCSIEVPIKQDRINRKYFCSSCCEVLTNAASNSSFILLDLFDLEQIHAYPIFDGADYDIREYAISIRYRSETEKLMVKVTGTL